MIIKASLPSIHGLVLAAAIFINPQHLNGARPVLIGGTENNTGPAYQGGFVVGYDFTVANNFLLTDLGFWDDNSDGIRTGFLMGFWETSSKTLLASAFIDDSDPLDGSLIIEGGSYRYETLGAPVALTGGTSYTLGVYLMGDYLSEALSPSESLILDTPVTASPAVTISDYRRFESSGELTFPNLTIHSFFPGNPNAKITSAPVPDSGSILAMLSLVVVGLSSLSRYGRF